MGSAAASSSDSDPTLSLPASEEVIAGSTADISGITYTDCFAQSNPGDMYLQIDDTSGTLSATDRSGTVSGSGTNSIVLTAPYADIVEALNSLTYVAPTSAGSDTINFDIWDQAGIQTTGAIPVGIAAAGGGTTETWTGAVSGDWNVAGNWSGGAVPSSNDTAIIPGRIQNVPTLTSATPVGETIVLADGATDDVVAGELDLSSSTINSLLEAQGVGNATVDNTWSIGSVGAVTSGANSILTVYGPEQSVQNDGLLIGAPGGTLDLIAGPPTGRSPSALTNAGSIIADGGSVDIGSISGIPGALPDWDIRNSGTIVTENGGALSVNGTIDGGQIVFNGSASLTLEQPQALIGAATVNDFGPGDQIDLIGGAYGTIAGFSGNELEIGTAGSIERIPFVGGFGLGNFEDETTATNPGTTSIIAFAYPGTASGITNPDIAAPAVDTIAHGATLSLAGASVTYMNDGTIDNAGSIALAIDAGSGTLYMNGATGSGTNQISTGTISVAQANADLATLNYVPAAGAQSDTVSISAAATPSQTMRSIPITVAGAVTSGPTLTEPSAETVAAKGNIAVSGSYADSFAQGNPGGLYLGISDTSGTLFAHDASGNPVAGSGTNNIGLSTDYTGLESVLQTLTYVAGDNAGHDTISVDIWNQQGVETTGTVPMTVTGVTSGPTLTEPSSETVAAGGSVAVSGSYSDSFAQGNPGDLFVGISETSGTLSATDASDHPVAGSGSNSIALSTDYADLNAVLGSLTYNAAANGGSTDDVHFDIWNQAGVETVSDTTIAIGTAPINATTTGIPRGPTFIAGPTTPTQPQADPSQIASLGSIDMANVLSMATGSGTSSVFGSMALPDTLTPARPAFLPNLLNDHPTHAGVVVPSHWPQSGMGG
jgi:hypothetical protein